MATNRDFFNKRLVDLNMSQRALARIMGMDVASLNRTLNGLRKCGLDEAVALARHLDLPLSTIAKNLGVEMAGLKKRTELATATKLLLT